MASVIPKPQMRGLLHSRLKVALVGAVASSIITGILWKVLVMDPRKQRYIDFYKTYDAEAKLKIMCDAGLMQSCGKK